jgi:hypothetical protein
MHPISMKNKTERILAGIFIITLIVVWDCWFFNFRVHAPPDPSETPLIMTDGQAFKAAGIFIAQAGIATNGFEISHPNNISSEVSANEGTMWRISWRKNGSVDARDDLVVLVSGPGRLTHFGRITETTGIQTEYCLWAKQLGIRTNTYWLSPLR